MKVNKIKLMTKGGIISPKIYLLTVLLTFMYLLIVVVFKLHVVKFKILAMESQEFFVFALFYNPSVHNHDDPISVSNRGEPVGDDKGRATLHEVFEGTLNG